MARLMVFISPPKQLEVDEAEDWLRRELTTVIGVAGVRSAVLSRLASASPVWSADWGWVVELDFETAELARAAVGEHAWSMLLGDLRLLGMRPSVALVDGRNDLRP